MTISNLKALQEDRNDVTYLIALAPYSLKSILFNIKEQVQEYADYLQHVILNSKFMITIWI